MNAKDQAVIWFTEATEAEGSGNASACALTSIAASLIRIGDLLEKAGAAAEMQTALAESIALYKPSEI